MKRRSAFLVVGLAWACLTAPARGDNPRPVDFAHEIVPLIKAHCAACHTHGKRKGGLSMDRRESILQKKAAIPGHSADSELFQRITSTDPEKRMPPKGPRLTPAEVARVRAWIDQGLPWQEGFSFLGSGYVAPLQLRRPTLPPARPGRDHPIDRIIDAGYARDHVPPPAALDDTAFIRRLYLDVIGLSPTPAEVDAYVQDQRPGKTDALIRRVLDDRRAYTEHWLTFWNDMLRNDYQGTGYIDGGRKQITAWLYRSLYDNKPYDQFVRELINPSPESEGFINGIKWRGRVNASQVREVQFSQNVSQVFFGVNMKCASCHDSFIDAWTLDDAYGLAAIIADHPLEINRCDKPTGRMAKPRFLWPQLGTIEARLPRPERLKRLADLMTRPDNGRFSRTIVNRLWQRLFGRGIVHPVDVMAERPWNEDLLDYLAGYLVDHHYDVKQLLQHILSSGAYQAQAAGRPTELSAEPYVFHGPEVKRMTAEQFLDAVWQLTRAGPSSATAPVVKPPFTPGTPGERQFVRAALVNADPLMRSLGRPNREQVVTTRADVLTTLEALDLSNGQILTDTLARGATNLLAELDSAGAEPLIDRIYRRALGRRPTPAELTTSREIVGARPTAESVADLLWTVLMLPEFQLIR